MEPDVKKKKWVSANKVIVVLLALLVIAAASAFYFYQKANSDPAKEAEKELREVMALVEKHMVLPKDEVPTLATVSDPEKLKDQRFFINAAKGDKVLVYSVSKKAILYSPSLDKIIEVAPVNIGGTE